MTETATLYNKDETISPEGEPTILIARVRAVCRCCGYTQEEKIFGPASGIRCDDFQAILQSRYEGWDEHYDICPECNGSYIEGDDE